MWRARKPVERTWSSAPPAQPMEEPSIATATAVCVCVCVYGECRHTTDDAIISKSLFPQKMWHSLLFAHWIKLGITHFLRGCCWRCWPLHSSFITTHTLLLSFFLCCMSLLHTLWTVRSWLTPPLSSSSEIRLTLIINGPRVCVCVYVHMWSPVEAPHVKCTNVCILENIWPRW